MLKGYSNFNIKLLKNKDGYFIKKSDGKRLQRQIDKQKKLQSLIERSPVNDYFSVPSILKRNSHSATMEFFNGKSILDIFETGDTTFLDITVKKLMGFIDWEYTEYNNTHLPKEYMLDFDNLIHNKIYLKLEEIKHKVKDFAIEITIDRFWEIFCKLSKEELYPKFLTTKFPCGFCHGDFTFSNMIFTDKIILLDFCDCYIETPLQDIAKLLQEIRLEWSLLINSEHRDIPKIKIAYNYLRNKLESKLLLYNKWCIVFYIMVLFRLFPYIKDKNVYLKVFTEVLFQLTIMEEIILKAEIPE
jgi:thiamine kinase-like enzyme